MSESNATLREQLAVFHRHRGKMVSFFVGVMLLVVLGIIFCPRKYESQAKLHVLLGRESLAVDPTAATGNQMINVMETREHEINTVRDLLNSRAILEQVVAELGPDAILKPKKKAGEAGKSSERSLTAVLRDWALNVNLADPVTDEERAVKKLAKDLKIHAEPKSNVIDVVFRSGTPEMAQQIGQKFLDAYQNQHGAAHRTLGSQDFFERQSELLAETLAQSEQALRDAKTEYGIVTVAASQLSLAKEIELIETDLLTTTVELEAAKAKVDALERSLKEIPERLVVEEVAEASLAADEMRKTLYELQIREKALAAKHTEKHPLVVAVRDQLAAAEKVLEAEEKLRTHPTTSLNPASQQQQLALLAEQAVVRQLAARHKALQSRLDELNQKLERLNEQEILVAELEREVMLRRDHYMTYTRNKEIARLDQELDSQRISNVNIVQPPSLIERPVSPPKAAVMILGLLMATAGSIGLALVCDSWNVDPPVQKVVATRAPRRERQLETVPR